MPAAALQSRKASEKQILAAPFIGVYNFGVMNMRRHINSIMLLLLISMMTNAFGWAFNGEVFAHELDHEHHLLSLDPTAHLEAHQRAASNDEGHMDSATHLCLHAAGQYQPFFFIPPPLVPAVVGAESPIAFLSVIVPESIPDSPLHPPKASL